MGQNAIPSCSEIIDILQLHPAELEKPENSTQKDIFLWYFNDWMPAVAGKQWFGDDIKKYKLLTDLQDVRGTKRVNVTITSEAFGLLMYENCQVKWQRMAQYKAKHGKKARFPKAKDDKDLDGNGIDYYQAKWSDSNMGQVQFGGWAAEAYERFEVLKELVHGLRIEDEKNGKAMQNYAKKLIRELHKVDEEAAPEKKNGRKRKAPKERAPVAKKLTREEE